MRRPLPALVVALAVAFAPGAGGGARAAEPHLAIVGGLGGEPYYADLFHRWAASLAEVAEGRLGVPARRVIRLEAEPARAAAPAVEASRKENVLAAVDELVAQSEADDVVALVLLGHGTARGDRALFNLPGPDLSAAELAAALDRLAGRTVVVVIAAPASAPFIEALSGPGRIVITATASAAENQHTRFGGHFVDALAGDGADNDKDGRVSVLEAFELATREVARAYETEGLLRTEHALLDDNGDGAGSRDPGAEGSDGGLAARVHLAAPAHDPDSSAGRRAVALDVAARRLVDRIEALKREKRRLERDEYLDRLETLLVELAWNRRALRRIQ